MTRRSFAVIFLACLVTDLGAAPPARLEFAGAEIAGRGVQALRLVLDPAGPARDGTLEIQVPEGTRFMRPVPGRVQLGAGAPAAVILHLFVSEVVPAGPLEVRGSIRDGGKETPLSAIAAVRSAPAFKVRSTDSDVLVGFESKPVVVVAVVQNTGNTPLQFDASAPTGSDGPAVTIEPSRFRLGLGAAQKVTMSFRAPDHSTLTTEHMVSCLFAATANGFQRTEQLVVTTVFVPRISDPGPLFATLDGSIEVGGAMIDRRGRMASQLILEGEIQPGVMFEAQAVDGVTSTLGSQLDLARRDTWHATLTAPGWHATAGEARGPSLGFLAPVVYGRGVDTGIGRQGWSAGAFALRDAFAGSVRDAAGLRFGGPEETWEAGAVFQRNRERFSADAQRVGAFVGRFWNWQGLNGRSQLAVAVPEGGGTKFGFAQVLGYQGPHFRIDGRYERAAEGFFLRDQSSETRSVLAEWTPVRGWSVFGGADKSTQTGRLRTLLQEQDNLGHLVDPAGVVELINQVATRQESVRGGVGREFSLGALRAGFKHQKRASELDERQEFSEDAWELEWTSRSNDPWWRLGTNVGRETGNVSSARFAEFQGAVQWSPTTRTRFETNLRWTKALAGIPQGFRREGIYGQAAASYRPAAGWSAEIRADGYDYKDYASRTKVAALVRFPLGNRGWSGAVEWARETQTGTTSTWLVVRAPLSIKMPWRPVRGAVGGRIVDQSTGAGLPGVMVQSGRQRAATDALGQYQLPAMETGNHPIRFQVPGKWTAGDSWPESVEVVAGRHDTLDLAAVKLARLSGEVVVTNPASQSRPAPAGVLVAEDAKGHPHETLVFQGTFAMSLPPGHYRLRFVSELPEEIGRQFAAEIEVGTGDVTSVRLEAREQERRLRRTLVPDSSAKGPN